MWIVKYSHGHREAIAFGDKNDNVMDVIASLRKKGFTSPVYGIFWIPR